MMYVVAGLLVVLIAMVAVLLVRQNNMEKRMMAEIKDIAKEVREANRMAIHTYDHVDDLFKTLDTIADKYDRIADSLGFSVRKLTAVK